MERGAVLVTHHQDCVVLQCRRGNLELIHPRPLIELRLGALLRADEYGQAYELCRRHRVDLDLMYHHASSPLARPSTNAPASHPTSVLAAGTPPTLHTSFKMSQFVHQVTNADHLCLFLMAFAGRPKPVDPKIRDRVCEEMRQECRVHDVRICSYVVQGNVKGALREVLAIPTTTTTNGEGEEQGEDYRKVEKSLKYLMFLVDHNTLYNEAMGMYEYPLALSIARRSSHLRVDEYEPFHGGVQALAGEPSRQKFVVDDWLRRFPSAIMHLVRSGAPEEKVLEYARAHPGAFLPLLNACLGGQEPVINPQSEYFEHLSHAYAEYLLATPATSIPMEESTRLASAITFYRLARQMDKAQRTVLEHPQFWRLCPVADVDQLIHALVSKALFQDALTLALAEGRTLLAHQIILKTREWQHLSLFPTISLPVNTIIQDLLDLDTKLYTVFDRARQAGQNFETRLGAFIKRFSTVEDPAMIPDDCLSMTSSMFGSAGGAGGGSRSSAGASPLSVKSKASQISLYSTSSKKKAQKHRLRDKPMSKHEREFTHSLVCGLVDEVQRDLEHCGELVEFLINTGSLNEAQQVSRLTGKIMEGLATEVGRYNQGSRELQAKTMARCQEYPFIEATFLSDVKVDLQIKGVTGDHGSNNSNNDNNNDSGCDGRMPWIERIKQKMMHVSVFGM